MGQRCGGFGEAGAWWTNHDYVRDLPRHHRDPFDRLLVAQALAQTVRLLTADRRLARYSELVWLHPS